MMSILKIFLTTQLTAASRDVLNRSKIKIDTGAMSKNKSMIDKFNHETFEL